MLQTPLLDESRRDALRRAVAALDAAEQRGQTLEISQALARVAACYRSLNALASAETYFETALRGGRNAGSTDQVVDLLCELCETAVPLSRMQDAFSQGAAVRSPCARVAGRCGSRCPA